jgi:Zn-dependent protease
MTVQVPAAKAPFRLMGVDIRIQPNVVILMGVIGWTLVPDELGMAAVTGANVWLMLGVVILGLGLSILLHEMGHTLVGRSFGMKIDHITLHVFGGVASFSQGPKTPISELLMAIAGPAVSIVLAGLFWQLSGAAPGDTLPRAFGYLFQINLGLAIFNMLPAFPMDGGRVLRSLIWMFTRNPRLATSIAANLGMGFGVLLMLGGVLIAVTGGGVVSGVWMMVMGLMVTNIARGSRPRRVARSAVPPTDQT